MRIDLGTIKSYSWTHLAVYPPMISEYRIYNHGSSYTYNCIDIGPKTFTHEHKRALAPIQKSFPNHDPTVGYCLNTTLRLS